MASVQTRVKYYFALSFMIFIAVKSHNQDQPCAARNVDGESVVCVCNATYCDTVTRETPSAGIYTAYTSSEAGLRFHKTSGQVFQYYSDGAATLELDPSVLHQAISGFGAAATDAAGINWLSLHDPRARQNLISSYFGKTGIEYNMMRVPIGGTDFSNRNYAYDIPEGDYELDSFTLAPEDYNYKIPLIKVCMEEATKAVRVIGSLWSPPTWMKTSHLSGLGFLKSDCYQTLADYFYKFIDSYADCGVPIWGITTTNEPLAALMFPPSGNNRLQWTVPQLGKWINDNLGPTIRNSTYKDVKIIGGDDQRFTIPLWFNYLTTLTSGALEYLDGIAVHSYFNAFTPPDQLTRAIEDYPDIFLIATESCEGSFESVNVDLGSWTRAENYAANIIEDLNHRSIGWIDWNMCLDESGGPSWTSNFVDSPIIVSSEKQEFYKQPMFYAMGHFSKFISRGSKRIDVKVDCPLSVQNVAFLTPHKTVVVVFLNKYEKREVIIKLGAEQVTVTLEAKSITTIELPYKST